VIETLGHTIYDFFRSYCCSLTRLFGESYRRQARLLSWRHVRLARALSLLTYRGRCILNTLTGKSRKVTETPPHIV
jgi:hypothetical protein